MVAIMKWYKRDPDAALSGMAELSFEECGAYNRLIDLFYSRDGHVPDDDVFCAAAFHCNPRTWRKVKLTLFAKRKVIVKDGLLVPNRGEYTLNEARTYSELQSNRARKRWEKRQKTSENNGVGMPLVAMPKQPQPQPHPQSPQNENYEPTGMSPEQPD